MHIFLLLSTRITFACCLYDVAHCCQSNFCTFAFHDNIIMLTGINALIYLRDITYLWFVEVSTKFATAVVTHWNKQINVCLLNSDCAKVVFMAIIEFCSWMALCYVLCSFHNIGMYVFQKITRGRKPTSRANSLPVDRRSSGKTEHPVLRYWLTRFYLNSTKALLCPSFRRNWRDFNHNFKKSVK